ncbi:MAG: hypothetical protein ACP6IS_01750 [Candidatus Asgardarchaeia archaeon]
MPGYLTSQLMFDALFFFPERLKEDTNFALRAILLDASFHSIGYIVKLDEHFKFIMAVPRI